MKPQRTANRTLRQYERRQRRWTYPTGKTVLLAFIPFILLIIVLAGCKVRVDARFPDGSPSRVTVIEGEHWDDAVLSAWDKTCALGFPCPGWTQPVDTQWQFETPRGYIGLQGSGRWVDLGPGQWVAWYCNHYWPSIECQDIRVAGVRG